MPRLQLAPYTTPPSHSVRTIYIQHLTDILHVCLSRGEYARARRAWAILIRCREVDWKSRWYWGLLLLDTPATQAIAQSAQTQTQTQSQASYQPTQTYASQARTQGSGREAERYLKALRVSALEDQRPALLHALVLHLIRHERHRAALDELETYLTSYPYLTSAPLHVYAGMICFYLAQPESRRRDDTASPVSTNVKQSAKGIETTGRSRGARGRSTSTSSNSSTSSHAQEDALDPTLHDPPNLSLLRAAKGWFIKALELDEREAVSLEFLRLISEADREGVLGDDGIARWNRDVSSSPEPQQGGVIGADEDEVMPSMQAMPKLDLRRYDDGLSSDSNASDESEGSDAPDLLAQLSMSSSGNLAGAIHGSKAIPRKTRDTQSSRTGRTTGTKSDTGARSLRRSDAREAGVGGSQRQEDEEAEDDGLSTTESEGGLFGDGQSSD